MVLVPPQARPSLPVGQGNHEARLRALERMLHLVGADGIKFNETNEELPIRYLIIRTNGAIPTTDNNIEITATALGAAAGDIELNADGTVRIDATTTEVLGGFLANAPGGTVIFSVGATAATVFLQAATKLQVKDSGGNPIFEVREDGTVHILTGGNVIADL